MGGKKGGMAKTSLRGAEFQTVGELPEVGQSVPAFEVTMADLSEKSAADFQGTALILNIFPSIDTPTCQASVRRFNTEASAAGATVLNVSADLPFAQGRFCGAEGLDRVVNGSTFRSAFGDAFGVTLAEGPMKGLLARAVVVVGADGVVRHSQLVADIGSEPDYEAALAAVGV